MTGKCEGKEGEEGEGVGCEGRRGWKKGEEGREEGDNRVSAGHQLPGEFALGWDERGGLKAREFVNRS